LGPYFAGFCQDFSNKECFENLTSQVVGHIENRKLKSRHKKELNKLISFYKMKDVFSRIDSAKDTATIKLFFNRKTKMYTLYEIYKDNEFINGRNVIEMFTRLNELDDQKTEAEANYFELMEYQETNNSDSVKHRMKELERIYKSNDHSYWGYRDSVFFYNSKHGFYSKYHDNFEIDYVKSGIGDNSINPTIPLFRSKNTNYMTKIQGAKRVMSHYYVIEFNIFPKSKKGTYKVFVPQKANLQIMPPSRCNDVF